MRETLVIGSSSSLKAPLQMAQLEVKVTILDVQADFQRFGIKVPVSKAFLYMAHFPFLVAFLTFYILRTFRTFFSLQWFLTFHQYLQVVPFIPPTHSPSIPRPHLQLSNFLSPLSTRLSIPDYLYRIFICNPSAIYVPPLISLHPSPNPM